MSKHQPTFFGEQFERLIPADDKFRLIKENIDFSFVDEPSRPLYSDFGPIGYPPSKLFRMLVVMYLDGICSERKLEERLTYDIRYRYFCDLDITDAVPDHATFSVFRSRLGDTLFRDIFERLIDMILALGFCRCEHLSIDSTSVIADCVPPGKSVDKEPSSGSSDTSGQAKASVADSDARWGVKRGLPPYFGYKFHSVVDSGDGLIVGVATTPANESDLTVGGRLLLDTLDRHRLEPQHVAGDTAYSSAVLAEELETREITPVMRRKTGGPRMAEGYDLDDFCFDGNTLVCPAERPMRRSNPKSGGVIFVGRGCDECTKRPLCTKAQMRRIRLDRHWLRRIQAAEFEKTDEFRRLYGKRMVVERVYSEAKRAHGLGRARYRSLRNVAIQGCMTAIAINLKRTARFLAQGPPQSALAHGR